MSVNLEKLTEEEVSELLLDCAKGRLSEDDARSVQIAAAENPAYGEELALYEGLARAGESVDQDNPSGELGWARLSRAIDAERQAEIKSQYVGSGSGPIWRYATFALGLVVMAQGALWFSSSTTTNDATYVTVTESVDSFDAQVMFNPDAVEIEIRELLRAVDGEIVMGPSAIGLYTVRFADEDTRRASLLKLNEATEIIESANPK